MAQEERGRRITFSANVKPLEKAFNKINALAKDSARELKKIERALKFDPHNYNLLVQKQRELNREVAQNNKAIGNLKRQISELGKSGDTRSVEKLTNKLENLRSHNNRLRESLKETKNTLNSLASVVAFDKLDKEITQSRTNVERLNKSLKFDTGNVSLMANKFLELKHQSQKLDEQVRLLTKDLGKIDFKTNPTGYREMKARLEEVKAKSHEVREELKKLGGEKFNPLLANISRLDNELTKSKELTKALRKELEFTPRNNLLKQMNFSEVRTQLSKTREKLKLMKQDLNNVRTTGTREEFVKLNVKIKESEREVKNLVRELGIIRSFKFNGIADGFGAIGEKAKKLADTMQTVGRNYSLAYSLPMAYGGKKLLDEFTTTDNAIRRVASAGADTIQGGFVGAFDRVEESAKRVSKGSVFSIKEVATGMEELVKANWSVKDATNEVGHVMNLAKVEGMELGAATEIVADGLASFGLTAKDTARFTDVLTMASVKSTTDITKMGETLKYVAPVAGALGYTIEDTATAISIMANNGIKASVAGTSLRAGLTNLTKPSKQAKKALDSVGFSMQDQNGKAKPLSQVIEELREKTKGMTEVQKQQFTATVFGKTAMSGWMAILNSSDSSVKSLTESIRNSKGATKEMADQMTSGLGGAIDRFKASVSNAAYETGKAWAPTLTSMTNGLTSLMNSFSGASDGTKQFVTGLTALSVAFPPLSWMVGGAIKQYSKLFSILKASPTGTVISLTTALMGLALANNPIFESTNKVREAQEKLKETFKSIGVAVEEYKTRLETAKNVLDEMFGKESYTAKLGELKNTIQEKYQEINNTIANAQEQNRQLNAQERQNVNTHIQELGKLEEERRTTVDTNFSRLLGKIKTFNANKSQNDKQYEDGFFNHLGTLKNLRDEELKGLDDWYQRQIELNNQLPPELQRNTQEIQKEYEDRRKKVNETFKLGLEDLQREYENRKGVEKQLLTDMQGFKNDMQAVEEAHNRRMELIAKQHFVDETARHNAITQEEARYQSEREWHLNNFSGKFDEHRIKLLGTQLGIIQDIISNGGTMTTEQATFVRNFLATMDTMDSETREKIIKGLEESKIDIDKIGSEAAELMKGKGSEMMTSLAGGISTNQELPPNAVTGVAGKVLSVLNNTDTNPQGQSLMDKLKSGVSSKQGEVENVTDSVAKGIQQKIKSLDMLNPGAEKSSELAKGIKSRDGDVWNASEQTANHGRNGAKSVMFNSVGDGMVGGIISGVNSSRGGLFSTLENLALGALGAAKRILGVFSPSRVFKREIGYNISAGISVGIESSKDLVNKSMKNTLLDTVKNAKEFNINDKLKDTMNFNAVSDYAVQHTVSQNNSVVDTLNILINKVNDLELKSDVYLNNEKVGEITHKQHEVINRRYGLL